MDRAYSPLLAPSEQEDIALRHYYPTRCRNILIYSIIMLGLFLALGGIVYFFLVLPGKHSSTSSDTVTIVNRHRDDISVYQVDSDGKESILAQVGPQDRVRLHPNLGAQCFIRHTNTPLFIQKIAIDGSTVVVGHDPDAVAPSLLGGASKSVSFVNHETEPIDLTWIDHTGKRVNVSTLEPEQWIEVETNVDHVFLLTLALDGSLIAQVTITPTTKVISSRPSETTNHQAVNVMAENKTNGVAKLYWRDESGGDHLLGEIAPNAKTFIDTSVGQELFFVDCNGDESQSTIIVPSTMAIRIYDINHTQLKTKDHLSNPSL